MEKTLEIAGFLIGLLYLYWEYRADWKMWIASVVMPAISLFVYWNAGLYADFGIDIYYLLVAVYGFILWTRGSRNPSEKQDAPLPISHTPGRMWMRLATAFLLIYAAITYILIHHTDSTVPWWDALNTSLSIIAMWMLARKWAEQWIVWMIVDAVSVGLYAYKQLPFYAFLYTLYTIVALFGYRAWKKNITFQGKKR